MISLLAPRSSLNRSPARKSPFREFPDMESHAIFSRPLSGATENNTADARLDTIAPARKRRRLEYVKCENCRKDKQKCLPIARVWPQRCDRCVDKGFQCSSGKRARRFSGVPQNPLTTLRPSVSVYQTRTLFGLDTEDWAFLLSYRTILAKAMDRLQKVRHNLDKLFLKHSKKAIEDIDQDAPLLLFEKFFAALDSCILKGAKKMLSSAQSREHPSVFTALLGQVVSMSYPRCKPAQSHVDPEITESIIHEKLIQAGDAAGQLLGYESLLKKSGSCLKHWYEACAGLWDNCELMPIIEVSADVHVKAKEVLSKLDLWDKMPEMSRCYASFLPEEWFHCALDLELSDHLSIPEDCLGRNLIIRIMDSKDVRDAFRRFYEVDGRKSLQIKNAIDTQDLVGRSALHIACQRKDMDSASHILDLGASTHLTTFTGALPLHYAAATGSSNLCERLLSATNANTKDKLGHTPLYYAVANERLETTRVLLKSVFVNPNPSEAPESPTMVAIRYHRIDLLSMLLAFGANPNGSGDATLLHQVIKRKNFSMLAILGSAPSINVNKRNTQSQTPLMLAARTKFDKGVDYLLNRMDTDLNIQDKFGNTALMHAVLGGHSFCIRSFLASTGTDLLLQNSSGQIAAELASAQGSEIHAAMIEMEIQRRYNPFGIADQG